MRERAKNKACQCAKNMSFKADIFLLMREFLTHCHFNLLFNKINPCQLFSHGMLNLNSGIDFHEIEVFLLI